MIYAYCVRRAGDPPPEDAMTGLEGAPVRVIEEAGVGLWVSAVPAVPASPERLALHDRVVRAALRTATPLPARYGSGAFPDEAAARAAMREKAADFLAALDRIANRVEMGIRVEWISPPAIERNVERATAKGSGPGRTYLESRRAELHRQDSTRAAAAAALDRVERACRVDDGETVRSVLPEPHVAGLLARLVRRDDVRAFRRRVDEAARALPDLRISPSGPWAPYSFT